MAMTACAECQGSISSSARSCPHCGAKVPRTKWWLWVPLGLVGAFFLYGMTIPEYESRAIQLRSTCEKIAGPLGQRECQALYDQEMRAGRQSERPSYQAPVDHALRERTDRERAAEDAKQLADCQKTLDSRKAQYERLMDKSDFWAASLTLRVCAELMGDQGLAKLVANAEIAEYARTLRSPHVKKEDKQQALAALKRDHPEAAKQYLR